MKEAPAKGAPVDCGPFQLKRSASGLVPVPKKLLVFFDSDRLQLFEFERVLIDQMIPFDRDALEGSWDRRVSRGSGRDEIVQAQFRRSGTGLSVMRTKPCASARGLVAAPVKWPGSRSLGVVLKAAT